MIDCRHRSASRLKIAFPKPMTGASPFPILLVQPSPAMSAIPPSSMAQVQQIMSAGSKTIQRWDTGFNELNNGGERFLDLLQQLSARHDTIHFSCPDEIEPTQLANLLKAIHQRQPQLRLSICVVIDGCTEPEIMDMDRDHRIVHLQWHVKRPLPDLGFFKAFSRARTWNHLVLFGEHATVETCRTVASHPNIIHSWEMIHAGDRGWDSIQAYGKVRPLPGRPLWQMVSDPVSRFLLVDRLTKDLMLRLRVDSDNESLYTVGDALEYHFLPPDRLPEGYLDEICAMVAAGGTVAATHVRFNLERAHLIGYVQENGVIVGNSSLKNPRPEYIERVRRQSELDLTGYLERGYTSVRPEYRGLGIGTRLLEGLTRRAGDRKIFSVIAEDNTATRVIATRNRTRQVATYFSQKAGKMVGVWMPEWMIDTSESA
jgi:GNAT superfamily N-acetyltransferase